jgi:hypothetical protein
MRMSEPVAWRDEALALLRRRRRGDWRRAGTASVFPISAFVRSQCAVRLLRRVVRGGWHARFAQVELVAAMVLPVPCFPIEPVVDSRSVGAEQDLAHAIAHAPGGRAALLTSAGTFDRERAGREYLS